MTTSNTKHGFAQYREQSARDFERLAVAFALTGFTIGAIGPDLHQFLAALSPLTPALKIAGGIFPMASEAVRIGRARALAKDQARRQGREREQRALEAHAEQQAAQWRECVARERRERETIDRLKLVRRASLKSARAGEQEAEAARLEAEIALTAAARTVIGNVRFNAETVRRRDEAETFWPDDVWCKGRKLPLTDIHGDVPGRDAAGRVLALVNDRLVYVRRTRLFALLMLGDMFRLAAVVQAHPAEAARMAIVREARALFWQCMRAMRDADKAWGL